MTPVSDCVKRSRSFACKPCNNARVAVIAAYKAAGQSHLWSGMDKAKQRREILENKGNSRGRGQKFPVKITEQAGKLCGHRSLKSSARLHPTVALF